MAKKRILSGMRPTGKLHLGNYVGALENWINLQDEYDNYHLVADYHVLTTDLSTDDIYQNTLEMVIDWLSAGLDPQKAPMFRQSQIKEHTELFLIFSMLITKARLERNPTLKEQVRDLNIENLVYGHLGYPVLQAADILLYKGEAVPVGEDQLPHIELCREIARKFNMRYGETFPDPMEILSEAPRIMGLDGKTKMSKSLGNYISLVESPESIWKKLSTAVTDENRKRRTDPGNPDICNLFTLHKYFSKKEQIDRINVVCRSAEIGCIECKKILSDNIVEALTPIRYRYEQLIKNPDYLLDLLHTSAKKCKNIAENTMIEVKKKMGLI